MNGDAVRTADVVIVGGGILGCAIAWHIRKSTTLTVIVLERMALASAATSQAAGLAGQVGQRACGDVSGRPHLWIHGRAGGNRGRPVAHRQNGNPAPGGIGRRMLGSGASRGYRPLSRPAGGSAVAARPCQVSPLASRRRDPGQRPGFRRWIYRSILTCHGVRPGGADSGRDHPLGCVRRSYSHERGLRSRA